jgi:SAM-dependent methyltransferase
MTASALKVPDRISWALGLLEVSADDRVLEFGCGPGLAVAALCERLGPNGRVTAIDRSETAVGQCRALNVAQVAAGRVDVRKADLAGLDAEHASFDKALGINVNLFWTTAAEAECKVLSRVLRPGGRLLLVYESPSPGGARDIGRPIAERLERFDFNTKVALGPTGSMVAVAARLRDAPGRRTRRANGGPA